MSNWDKYYFELCNTVATNSKCLSRKIGAIIVKDKSIISTGYNGPPRNVPDCSTRYINDPVIIKEFNNLNCDSVTIPDKNKCPRQLLGYKSGQRLDLCVAGHAERNAIVNAARHGIAVKGATIYMNCGVPCSPCLIEIINSGIVEIVCIDPTSYYDKMGEWLVNNSGIIVRWYRGMVFDHSDGTMKYEDIS